MPENPKMDPVNRVKNATTDETNRKRKELLDQTMPLSAEAEGACAEVVVEAAEDLVVTEEVAEVVSEASAILIGNPATIRRV
jgi:2-succinyl-5-enolpyruvyl-6-hydroxy-3-cyclohexene-1-carboxylate synthase